MKAKRAAPQSQPNVLRTKTKQRFPKWFIPTVATLGALILFFTVWQLASFTFKTQNGTIVIENMPADAEVLVDGQKFEIAWNAGKDKAEVSINAGTHQLRVVNQGNEIYGEKVSLKGGDSTVVKLSVVKPVVQTAGTDQPPVNIDSPGPSRNTTAAGATTQTTNTIPKDAVRYKNKYYKVYPTSMTWSEAREECRKLGGRLGEVYDEGEHEFLVKLAQQEVAAFRESVAGAQRMKNAKDNGSGDLDVRWCSQNGEDYSRTIKVRVNIT